MLCEAFLWAFPTSQKVCSYHTIQLSFVKISGPVAFYQFLLNFELMFILSVVPITSVHIVPVSQLVLYCPLYHPPHPHQLGSALSLSFITACVMVYRLHMIEGTKHLATIHPLKLNQWYKCTKRMSLYNQHGKSFPCLRQSSFNQSMCLVLRTEVQKPNNNCNIWTFKFPAPSLNMVSKTKH